MLKTTATIFCLAFTLQAQAAIPGINFYRAPGSLFPSGQANPSELMKRKQRDFTEINYLVQKDTLQMKLPTNFVLRDMDLSLKLVHQKSGLTGLVIGTRGPWAAVVAGPKNAKAWWSLGEVMPVPDDRGLAVPLTNILLRAEPKWKTARLAELPALTKLRIHNFLGDWVEVSPLTEPSRRGFVDMGSLVLKHDFASFILPKDGKWVPVKYRQGHIMVTGMGERIPIDQVQAMMTRPDLGVMAKNVEGRGLNLRNFVMIKNFESITWAVSTIAGHGEVFWQMDGSIKFGDESKSKVTISFDEILKKPIFSVAFHPQNPRMGIISAEGIYMTTDGINWRKVDMFQSDNLPVAISPNHEIFAGHFRSTDQGRSFTPYLKWEQVATQIEGKSNRAARILRLVKINPRADRKIEIEVDTGTKTARLQGSTKFGLVTEWKTLKQ